MSWTDCTAIHRSICCGLGGVCGWIYQLPPVVREGWERDGGRQQKIIVIVNLLLFICSQEVNVLESGEDYYWAWAASVAGLVVHILAVVHMVLWGLPSLIVGSLVDSYHVFSYTIILHTMYMLT